MGSASDTDFVKKLVREVGFDVKVIWKMECMLFRHTPAHQAYEGRYSNMPAPFSGIQEVSHASLSSAPEDPGSCLASLDTPLELTNQYSTGALADTLAAEMFPLVASLDLLEPRSEFLLTYCKFSEYSSTEKKRQIITAQVSNYIAPQMVVMDDCYNGWRCFILPFACADKMVMDAVSAVSAFHICEKGGHQRDHRPDKFYAKVISGLQSRSTLRECDLETRQSVFVAILALLVGVMVNGSSDFPILFYMLQSALEAIGGERGLGDGEFARFIMRQIRK